jgi:UDP-N-acetylmuramoylalanine--D-glutamate ligase
MSRAQHIGNSPLGDVCVLGLGVTGLATVEYLLKSMQRQEDRVFSLTIYGGEGTPQTRTALELLLTTYDVPSKPVVIFDTQVVSGSFDLAIVSPGIPPHSELYRSGDACAHELISEPEFAFRESPMRWVAVTGTNGKTTTTALTAHLLSQAGFTALAVGNIGVACVTGIQTRGADDYLVAELSSYQLYSTLRFAPDAAILLNITPDHLSWHGSHQEYANAKQKVYANMTPRQPVVIDATLPQTRALVRTVRDAGRRVIPLGTADGLSGDMTQRCGAPEAAFVNPATHMLTVVLDGQRVELVPAEALQLKGEHNQQNALAAAAVALALGAEPADVRQGLVSFKPLEHRIEPCGTVASVGFYNDSKATNTDATIKALAAFGDTPLVALYGGRDKGTELSELVQLSARTCRAVVCYGEAGARFAAAFDGVQAVQVEQVPTFADAFATGVKLAQPGDALLLSPACASFDEFDNFEQRGERFKTLVAELKQNQTEAE